jgi:hypothetical protein
VVACRQLGSPADLQPGLVGQAEIEDNHIRRLRADVFEPGIDDSPFVGWQSLCSSDAQWVF